MDGFLLPRHMFRNGFGLGIDFGSSITKIAYTSLEDGNLRVHLVLHPKESPEGTIKFLADEISHKLEENEIKEVFGTGVGTGQHIGDIKTAINTEVTITSELACPIAAFKFMAKNMDWDDFILPTCVEARTEGAALARQVVGMCPVVYPDTCMKYWRFLDEENAALQQEQNKKIRYPLIIYLAGSASGCLLLHEDGIYELLNVNNQAGRMFLALGSLLTGAQDFKELIGLAEAGDSSMVDVLYNAGGATEDDGIYKTANDSILKLFAFGHAVGKQKDDFKREDLAAAVVSLSVQGMTLDAANWARSTKVQQVFFIGGFTAHSDYIRQQITREFAYSSYTNPLGHVCECFFIKNGGHMGAFGSLLKTLQDPE